MVAWFMLPDMPDGFESHVLNPPEEESQDDMKVALH
jgi:hypothetical protein